jgi:hypothetical protein
VVPFKNVFFKSITALLVTDSENAGFDLDSITPRSISVGPQETAQFTVTLLPEVNVYTTSGGVFQKITLQNNWPWYPNYGGTRSDLGPSCNYDGENPPIISPMDAPTYEAVSPPDCAPGDVNVTNLYAPPNGAIRITDSYGDFFGLSVSTSISGQRYEIGNNPFNYDCEVQLAKYTPFSLQSFQVIPEFPFRPSDYRWKNWCYFPSYSIDESVVPMTCESDPGFQGTFNINDTPPWPSCLVNNVGTTSALLGTTCTGTKFFQRCAYDPRLPQSIPLHNTFQYSFQNLNGAYYPIGQSGICDPFIQNVATYTTQRYCSNSGGGPQFLNFYIQDASLGVRNTPQANRSTQSLDYPILGGFLATIGPDTSSNALVGKRAYAYGFSLDNYFSIFR